MKLFVTRIDPSDVKEWVKGVDKKTKKVVTLKASTSAAQNFGYHIQLLCKDISTQSNSKIYKFLLSSSPDSQKDDPATEFFRGQKPENLHKNEEARKKLEDFAQMLTKFNTWVDAIVERRNGWYFIKDTKLIAP